MATQGIVLLLVIFGILSLIAYIVLRKLGYINFGSMGTSTRLSSIGTGGMPWGSGDNW